MQLSMAIDAGGTYFKYGVVDGNGAILDGSISMLPVNSKGSADEIFDCYEKCINDMRICSCEHDAQLIGLGVSTPGPFDYARYTSEMDHKFASIKGIDIRQALVERRIIDSNCKVSFLHDGHAFLLGECWTGAAAGFKNVIGITIGTGLGIGYYLNGQLCDNGKGGPMVSIFGLPYGKGIVEDVVSGNGILNYYNGITDCGKAPDCKEVGIRADNGDRMAINSFIYAGKVLGQTIAPLIEQYDIECCVLGGQVSRSFEFIKIGMVEAPACLKLQKLSIGKNLNTSTLVGAASLTFNE
jgi:glucokinase